MLKEHAQRVRDGHRALMQAANMGDITEQSEAEDMGDIIIAGDIYGTDAPVPWTKAAQQAPPQPTPQPQAAQPEAQSEAPAKEMTTFDALKKLAVPAAALATGGIGAPLILWASGLIGGGEDPKAQPEPAPVVRPVEPIQAEPIETQPGGIRLEVKPYEGG